MSNFTIISFIRKEDSVLTRNFIEHHRSIGVTEFRLVMLGAWPGAREEYLLAQPDVVVVEKVAQPYSEALTSRTCNKLIQSLIGEWVVLVEGDEFLELPHATLADTAACMRDLGVNDLPAFVVQRHAKEGVLCEPDEHGDINDQFELMNFSLCEDLNTPNPTWKEKFPFFYVTSDCKPTRDNHLPPNGRAVSNAPLRAVIHRFQWTAEMGNALADLHPDAEQGDRGELSSYKDWLANNDYRLPTRSSINYSRDALFDQGLLITPSQREFEIAAALANVARLRKTRAPAAIEKWMAPLRRSSAHVPVIDQTLVDPRNLLLEPGRICFVSFEISGPTTSGGIGTAVGALAESLVQLGHDVAVVYCPFRGAARLDDLWSDYWARRGVRLHYLPRSTSQSGYFPEHSVFNERLDELLERLEVDLIHFVDAGGYAGRFCRKQRSSGRKRAVRTVLTVHGPGEWHRRGNLIPWQDDEPHERAAFTYALELADAVVFPSRYMVDWTKARYRISARHGVIPNVLTGTGRSFGTRDTESRTITEVAFFGRIEERKGFFVFCEAMQKLAATHQQIPQITMLGRLGENMREDDVFAAFGNLRDRVRYIGNYGNIDAINYLKTRNCVAVIPSKVDNLPYTVYESVENAIPIMTTDVGGIGEMIDKRDHGRVLVGGDSETLAKALRDALIEGFAPAKPAFEASMANVEQLALHARLIAEARGTLATTGDVRPGSDATIAEIHYGVAGSGRGEASDPSGNWATEANNEVRRAAADYVYLLDKNVSVIDGAAVESMMQLQRVGDYDAIVSDCLVTFGGASESHSIDEGTAKVLTAPARPPELSPIQPIYGAGSLLIKRCRFLEFDGFNGRLSDSRYAHWELLNRLQAAQCRIGSVPVPLVAWHLDEGQWYERYDDEVVELLMRPWLQGLNHNQENAFRCAIATLGRERPRVWTRQAETASHIKTFVCRGRKIIGRLLDSRMLIRRRPR